MPEHTTHATQGRPPMTADCGLIEWDDRPGGRWVEVEPDRLRLCDFRAVVAVVDGPGVLSGRAARVCGCGHERAAHEHYRSGSDCAHCACPRFRWRPWKRAL